MKKNTINYSPLYFLASLGAGGTSVMFFMYLMFMTKHSTTPIPTFNSILNQFNGIDTNIFLKSVIIFALIGIIFFAILHFKILIWNIKKYNKFKKDKDFTILRSNNKEVQLMAYPLTLAMSVNVLFILGAVFIPNLWNIVEYLFPIALLAFGLIGFFALNIFGKYITRLITTNSFDFVENNNLSQMVSVFAFVMIGVGFAASAAMSHTQLSAIIGLIGSIFFITIAIFFGIIKIILGFKSIFKNGLNIENSPTIWIIIPILTLIGISVVRQSHGLEHNFDINISSGFYFLLTTIIISIQMIFGYIGYKVMKKNNYFKDYIYGNKKSPGSYSVICPGVATVVFGFFFINLGLVKTGIIDKFGIMYFLLLLPLIYIQFTTIKTFFRLNKKLL